ncbi:helix-turn-helix domain-containing protein [Macrococcus animalis]|uniref:helix-turn-helix domain-containing protein n=1 Tax=Macrococcus animalis TaxID=3395467 RepID=UPI0039BE3711
MKYKDIDIGSKVKYLRKRKKLTQREFAEKLGISKSYLGDIELNRKKHFGDTLENLSQRLGMSLEDFLSVDENGEK